MTAENTESYPIFNICFKIPLENLGGVQIFSPFLGITLDIAPAEFYLNPPGIYLKFIASHTFFGYNHLF